MVAAKLTATALLVVVVLGSIALAASTPLKGDQDVKGSLIASPKSCKRLASHYGKTFLKSLFERGGKLGNQLCDQLARCRALVSDDAKTLVQRDGGGQRSRTRTARATPTNSRPGTRSAKQALAGLGGAKKELHWLPLETTGEVPPGRKGHTFVRVGDKMYVFGGCSDGGECYNDLYVLDMKAKKWFKAPTKGTVPPPRTGHSAVSFEDGELVVFGGKEKRFVPRKSSGSVEDEGDVEGAHQMVPSSSVYSLDTRTLRWTHVRVSGDKPSARFGHTAMKHGENMVVYGGHSGQSYLGDVHALNWGTKRWSKLNVSGRAPSSRMGHTATPALGGMAVFGGKSSGQAHSDLHVLKSDTDGSYYWAHPHVKGVPPSRRGGHDALPLENGGIRVMGGCGINAGHCYSDAHDLDPETMHWHRKKIGADYFSLPEGHAMIPIEGSDGGAYGFGGCSESSDYTDAASGCTNNLIVFGDDDSLGNTLDMAEVTTGRDKKKDVKNFLKGPCDGTLVKKGKSYCGSLLKKMNMKCDTGDEVTQDDCKKERKKAYSKAKSLRKKQMNKIVKDAKKKAEAQAKKLGRGVQPEAEEEDDGGTAPDKSKAKKKGKKGAKKGEGEEGGEEGEEGEEEGEGEGAKKGKKKNKDSKTPGAPGAPGSPGVKPPVAKGANRTEIVDDGSGPSNSTSADDEAEKEKAEKESKKAAELEACKHADFPHTLNSTNPRQPAHIVRLICKANYEMVKEPINMKMIAHSTAEYLREDGHVVGIKSLRLLREDMKVALLQMNEHDGGYAAPPRYPKQTIFADDRDLFLRLVEEQGEEDRPPVVALDPQAAAAAQTAAAAEQEPVEKNDKIILDLLMPHEAVTAFKNSSLSSKCFQKDLRMFGIDKCTNVTDLGQDALHVIQPADSSQFRIPPSNNKTSANGPQIAADHGIFKMGYQSCTKDCGGHGSCASTGATCVCDPMYYIPPGSVSGQCEKRTSELTCPQTSKKCMYGECTAAGSCECYPGYESPQDGCKVKLKCPKDCSDHGTCEWGTCWCDDGWGGDDGDCATDIRCPSGGCNEDNAYCYRSTCYCKQGYTGSKCQYGPVSEEEMEMWKTAKSLGFLFVLALLAVMMLSGAAFALIILAIQHLWGKRDKLNQIASGQLLDSNEPTEKKPYRSEVWRRRET